MGVLRLFRSHPSPVADDQRQSNLTPAAGLDGFDSEVTFAAPSIDAPSRQRSDVVVVTLLAVVLLQAVPTALWVRDYFFAAARAEAAAPSPSTPDPAVPLTLAAAAAPCDPTALQNSTAAQPPSSAPGGASNPEPPVLAPTARPAIVAGLVSIDAPLPMQIYARGRLVGTTESETVMLPVGTHDLELVNDSVGYRARHRVTVQDGRTAVVRLNLPDGTLHVNAVPWAEVWLDNERIGETPIGNLKVPIGSRELVFRHPEFGERRTRALVTLNGPTRISMDLRKQ